MSFWYKKPGSHLISSHESRTDRWCAWLANIDINLKTILYAWMPFGKSISIVSGERKHPLDRNERTTLCKMADGTSWDPLVTITMKFRWAQWPCPSKQATTQMPNDANASGQQKRARSSRCLYCGQGLHVYQWNRNLHQLLKEAGISGILGMAGIWPVFVSLITDPALIITLVACVKHQGGGPGSAVLRAYDIRLWR